MYNYPYYNQQPSLDRINNQIAELEKMKTQIQQPVHPSINQTFQLSPNQGGMKYVNTIDDVNKEIVFNDTAFFSNDMSVLWVKNASGDVKSYELKEIIEKDEKDVQIEFLMAKISELEKEMNANARTDDSNVDEPTKSKKSTDVSDGGASKKKSK